MFSLIVTLLSIWLDPYLSEANLTSVTYAVVAVQATDGQTLSRIADEELRTPIHRKDVLFWSRRLYQVTSAWVGLSFFQLASSVELVGTV